jgi:enamine deaminase RidA (YjgF/YER057c/UK114 family)
VTRHNPPTVWRVPDGFKHIYTHAVEEPVVVTRRLHVSGQLGVSISGVMADGFISQCEQAMRNIEALLASADMTRSDIVKTTYFLTRAADLSDLGEIRRQRWASDCPQAVTVLVVSALAHPQALIEIEATASK